jgi:hypothetical protein
VRSRLARRTNLPSPRPDELLYSLIARTAVHVGHWSPKGLLGAVYGDRGTLAIPDVPSSLGLIQELCGMAWDISLEELAYRHTLHPYYTYFLPTDQRTKVMQRMLHRREYLHLRLGICASGVRRTRYFRLCPSCSQEDLAQHGETYWRRIHHLPGVVVCAVHGEPLLETSVPYRPIGRHEHLAAHPRFLRQARPIMAMQEPCEAALAIASRSAALLGAGESSRTVDYRPVLRAHGFVGRHGGSARFEAAVRTLLPAPLLAAMFTCDTADALLRWLDPLRRKPRRILHPLKHLVAQTVLEALADYAIAAPATVPRRGRIRVDQEVLRPQAQAMVAAGCSIRATAMRLGIAWETAQRLLTPEKPRQAQPAKSVRVAEDRAAWTALRASAPCGTRTELRRLAPALYARLYRADRAWLLCQSCARHPRAATQRVDWTTRDCELADRIAAVAQDILSRTPAIRASRCRVLGELQVRALVAFRAEKLPRTLAVLASQCETVEAFQIRRLTSILKARGGAKCALSKGTLLRAARINPDRIADHGDALIDAAKRACV